MANYPYKQTRRDIPPPVPRTHPLYTALALLHPSYFSLCQVTDYDSSLMVSWENKDRVVNLLFDKSNKVTQLIINLPDVANIILAPSPVMVRDYLLTWRAGLN